MPRPGHHHALCVADFTARRPRCEVAPSKCLLSRTHGVLGSPPIADDSAKSLVELADGVLSKFCFARHHGLSAAFGSRPAVRRERKIDGRHGPGQPGFGGVAIALQNPCKCCWLSSLGISRRGCRCGFRQPRWAAVLIEKVALAPGWIDAPAYRQPTNSSLSATFQELTRVVTD